MRTRILAGVGLIILMSACTTMEPLSVREEKYGKASPVITQSFAAQEVDWRDTWKIFLKASDADGDMKTIILTWGRREGAGSEITWTRIQEKDRRELSGYLYWYPGPNAQYFMYGFLTVQIEDRAGHRSNVLSFPIEFKEGVRQVGPPRDIFQEKELGPVMIHLKRSSANGGSSS